MILIEGKQVGTLYHFTEAEMLDKISMDEGLKTHVQDYISFTRNFNMPKTAPYHSWSDMRFCFDGDKLSNKYKIEPFLQAGTVIRSDEEQEERIVWPINKILPCFFALKRIDILNSAEINKKYWLSTKLPIYFVDKFKPVR